MSIASKPIVSMSCIMIFFCCGSAPETGRAMRCFDPFGMALWSKLSATMLLNALMTGRPSTFEVHSLSIMPSSISAILPSRSG